MYTIICHFVPAYLNGAEMRNFHLNDMYNIFIHNMSFFFALLLGMALFVTEFNILSMNLLYLNKVQSKKRVGSVIPIVVACW